MTLVTDFHCRERLDWHLSRSGRSKKAESALEQTLTARFDTHLCYPAWSASSANSLGIER